ncbi:hypothetical protein [Agrococcus sp. SGAir0287]|uniref:hypothetical protein n=1 Tax=Agrococcus sp. SGAir0287 TaxID=2070347 RepID=UPI0010CD315E|nr:hypothetical protein [Agrococcus sp. SGAir0287]QCR18190.1 hypothetical protein C1N71_00970 [Agrococcus sp. SGAir0287]
MTRVAASLWSVAPGEQHAVATRLADAGVRRFHWDAADGTIGPAGGFTADEARRLTPRGCAGEAHLMTIDPLRDLDDWLPLCDTIAVHAVGDGWRAAIDRIRAAGATPALAVASAAELVAADLPPDVGVLVMAVAPGHAGSRFDERAVEVVHAARAQGRALVGVDGSVTDERGRALVAAGASWLVSGTSLTASDPAAWLAAVSQR